MSNKRPTSPAGAGRLVVISGPSGVGKSTIVQRAVEQTGADISISATTRKPRPGEKNGVDYVFLDRPAFEKMKADDELLEWAEVFGNYYGTPAEPVRRAVERGSIIVLNIDVQGGLQIAKKARDAVFILILPPSQETLVKRLAGRKTESPEQLKARTEKAMEEIRQAELSGLYNNKVVNDNLDDAVAKVVRIIKESQKS